MIYDRMPSLSATTGAISVPVPYQIREEIRRLRRELGKGGGFILAPCKHIDRVVPAENLAAIYETFIEENYKFR